MSKYLFIYIGVCLDTLFKTEEICNFICMYLRLNSQSYKHNKLKFEYLFLHLNLNEHTQIDPKASKRIRENFNRLLLNVLDARSKNNYTK